MATPPRAAPTCRCRRPKRRSRPPVRGRRRRIRAPGSGQCAAIERQSGAGRHDCNPGPETRRGHHQRRRPVQGVFGWRQYGRRLPALGILGPRDPGSRRCARDLDPAACRSARDASAAHYAPGAGARSATTVAAVENIRRMVQQDPALLDQVMRTVPSYDNAAGKLRGFRAYPGRNRQIFSKLGLRAGDLVTAINGTPLDDPQRSQEVFNTIQILGPRDRDHRARRPETGHHFEHRPGGGAGDQDLEGESNGAAGAGRRPAESRAAAQRRQRAPIPSTIIRANSRNAGLHDEYP